MPLGESLAVEIYPSFSCRRYNKDDRTADQQDTYCVVRWLAETDLGGFLQRYSHPALTDKERGNS